MFTYLCMCTHTSILGLFSFYLFLHPLPDRYAKDLVWHSVIHSSFAFYFLLMQELFHLYDLTTIIIKSSSPAFIPTAYF